MTRTPAVANMFYPGKEMDLKEVVNGYLKPVKNPQMVTAAISPHAGYMYSGAVAGAVFSQIVVPDSVVLLGPNHRGLGARVAMGASESWQTPLGVVPTDEDLAQHILVKGKGIIREDMQAHTMEHSIEVQIPFLQTLQPALTIVPISVSHVTLEDCKKVGEAIAAGVNASGKTTLLVASTDMTHYEPQKSAQSKDKLAIEQIIDLSPARLYDVVAKEKISMCGVFATTVALYGALALGASRADLVQYATSGDVSGDLEQVVGYAGLIVL